jgi:hypothetical protein
MNTKSNQDSKRAKIALLNLSLENHMHHNFAASRRKVDKQLKKKREKERKTIILCTRQKVKHLNEHESNIYTSHSKWILPQRSIPILLIKQLLK